MARVLLVIVVQLMLMVVLPVTGKQRIPRAQKVARLRELLESKNMTQMPCVYDVFTTRMVDDM